MPKWINGFFKPIRELPSRGSPRWPWPLRKVRKANILPRERDFFERYGENVISNKVSGSFDQDVEHAREWLTERADYHERSEQWIPARDLILELVIIALIGWEICLGYQQEHLQSRNFKEQQQVLTNLQNSSAETAKELTALQRTNELMNATLQLQLDAAKKSAAQTERNAKAGEASASTASQALHVSERAYVHVEAVLTSIPKVGEKLGFQAYFQNSGRTPALEVVTRVRSGLDPTSDTAEHARSVAFGPSVQIPYTSKGIIPAGGKVQTSWQSAAPLSQAEMDGLTTHRMTLRVFAVVTYQDEFNRPHQTNFCVFWDPTTETLPRCGTLNDAN
jgi:hypothetical protein